MSSNYSFDLNHNAAVGSRIDSSNMCLLSQHTVYRECVSQCLLPAVRKQDNNNEIVNIKAKLDRMFEGKFQCVCVCVCLYQDMFMVLSS